MASVWKPAKACHGFNNDFTLFTAVPVLFIMYTNKNSNLISILRTNYGDNSVRTFRKMGNYHKENGRLQESQEVHTQMH